jgi:hypothetical protein
LAGRRRKGGEKVSLYKVSTRASRRRRIGAQLREWWGRRSSPSGKHRPDVVAVRMFEANVRMFGVRRAVGTTPVELHPFARVSSSSPSAAEPPSIEFAALRPRGSGAWVPTAATEQSASVSARFAVAADPVAADPSASQPVVPTVPQQRRASRVGLNAYRAR